MKTSSLILLAAAGAALYFFVLRKAPTAVPAAPLAYPTPPASRTPEQSWGEQTLDTAIKSGADLAGDLIGSLFG